MYDVLLRRGLVFDGTGAPPLVADVAIRDGRIDPDALGDELDRAELAPMEFFDGYQRLVRRNDAAVRHVFVGGREAIAHGTPTRDLGRARLGAVLRSRTA